MRLLVIGRDGQVSTELLARAGEHEMTALGLDVVDLTKPETGAAAIRDWDGDAVINAAAYTAVDKAEEDEDIAHLINAEGPRVMAEAAAAKGLPFLHISTDYVFPGGGETPWVETDPTGPLGAYGRTKLAGEEGVAGAGGAHAILRTSWVFSAHGNNFVKTMLRLGRERDALRIVKDQIGGPTAAGDIAEALLRMAEAYGAGIGTDGVFHFSGGPDVSWEEFAREIFAQSGIEVSVEGIPTSDYPTPAERPLNSRLDCSRIEKTYGIARPDWRVALKGVLEAL
jgi:dTDP-4-dehydrorhamnose reductase